MSDNSQPSEEMATIAGGCFWCTEAIFRRLRGVTSVISGYSGGSDMDVSYEQVSTGKTGHAEAIQITFDPTVISYKTLLEVFFKLHDPTTLNQQGADVGTQYRSAIFYHTEKQKQIAESLKKELDTSGKYKSSIVTEIALYTGFYKAEEHHQSYYEKNSFYPYCQVVIDPKIKKLYAEFKDLVKENQTVT